MRGVFLVIVCTLPALLSANPLSDSEPTSIKDTFNSLLRIRRQNGGACTSQMDCFADQGTTAPTSLVRCLVDTGVCECFDCFMMDSNGRCSARLCPDYIYDNGTQVCGNDGRPTQLAAFLISLFVSSTGAANFYIGQNGLGGGQIALLLITLIFSYAMCYLPCCLACCIDDVKGSIIFILLMVVCVILVTLASLAISAWWIADVIIFATNQRPAGNGCTLRPWA